MQIHNKYKKCKNVLWERENYRLQEPGIMKTMLEYKCRKRQKKKETQSCLDNESSLAMCSSKYQIQGKEPKLDL